VALPVVDRDTFLDEARPAVERAAANVDWTRLLTAYEWDGADWGAGVAARASMHRRLKTAGNDQERAAAVAEIVAWGGLPPLSADAVRQVLASLPLLDADVRSAGPPLDNLYAKRIPAVSKVYAMYTPPRWVIYDSRVARGLALIALELFGEGLTPTVLVSPAARTDRPAHRRLPAAWERRAGTSRVRLRELARAGARLANLGRLSRPQRLGCSPCRDGAVHAWEPGWPAGTRLSVALQRRDP
jgi:hypothetical protein